MSKQANISLKVERLGRSENIRFNNYFLGLAETHILQLGLIYGHPNRHCMVEGSGSWRPITLSLGLLATSQGGLYQSAGRLCSPTGCWQQACFIFVGYWHSSLTRCSADADAHAYMACEVDHLQSFAAAASADGNAWVVWFGLVKLRGEACVYLTERVQWRPSRGPWDQTTWHLGL